MKPVSNRLILAAFLMTLAWSACTTSQTAKEPASLTQRQVADDFVTFLEKQLIETADAMPEDKYSFVPTSGEFRGVRSFGEQVKHLAAANHILAAAIVGEPAPPDAGDETGPETVRTKTEILNYLKQSFVALHRAAAAIPDKNPVVQGVPISPLAGRTTPLGLAMEALIHTENHYGQMVEYLRMNGIVPPASR